MTAIPFPVSSSPGAKPQEGGGRLINCFAVKNEASTRFPVLWRRCSGLTEITTASHIHLRGAIKVNSTLILVMDTRSNTVTESGGVFTLVNRGAIAGTEAVTIAVNNAATPDIVCVTAAGAKNLFVDAAPSDFADGDLPAPNSVSSLNGYFIFTIGDGRIFASGLNAVTIATNSFTTAQRRPGGLIRGVAFRNEFYAFGPSGCEVYSDAGTSPFPLAFNTFIPRGIVGTNAVSGWEEGWSNDLIWVGDDNVVYRLNGYTPEPISNDDVSRDVAAAVKAGDGDLLEASVYMQGNNAIWRLTYPDNWTWEYNKTTQNWHERQSDGVTDQRGSCTVRAFDMWLCGDRTTGKIFEIDESAYLEGADPLRYIVRSGSFAAFPSRLVSPRMDFDFTAAVGIAAGEDPIETDPSVLIRWSRDGGYSFGNPVTRHLGGEGEGNNRVTVLRGPASGPKGIVVEVEVDDPVHAGFLGGQMAIEQRSE